MDRSTTSPDRFPDEGVAGAGAAADTGLCGEEPRNRCAVDGGRFARKPTVPESWFQDAGQPYPRDWRRFLRCRPPPRSVAARRLSHRSCLPQRLREIACKELVELVIDCLDGVLSALKAKLQQHLDGCQGPR
jgi:hypothetical protein